MFRPLWSNKSLIYYIDLITVLVGKELKVRYKRSLLGYLWSILNPLAMAMMFYFALKLVLRVPIENYSFFLITGLFPWQWFSNSVGSAPGILISNASLIKKVSFPVYFIPLTVILNDSIHFLLTIPIILLFGLLFEVTPSMILIVGIPLWFLVEFLLTYALVLLISSVNLFFRDLERLVTLFLLLIFYFTPIFYDLTLVPEAYRRMILLNPATCLIVGWRDLFMKGSINFASYLFSLFYALLIFLSGFYVFKRLSYRFAEVL